MPDTLRIPFTSVSLSVFPLRLSLFQSKTTSEIGELLYYHSLFLQVSFPEPNGTQQRPSRNAFPFLLLTSLSSVKYLVLPPNEPLCVCWFQTGLAVWLRGPACGVSYLGGLALWGDLTLLAWFLEPLSKTQDKKTHHQCPGNTILDP